MATYQQYYGQTAPAPQKQGVDVAAWALVAIVVAAICGAAGWAIARNDSPSSSDLARTSALTARDAAAQGMTDGYARGAKAGRTTAALRASVQTAQAKRDASTDGYNAGYAEGQSRAQSRADGFGYVPSSSAAYPGQDFNDVLNSGLFDDAPGYSDSAFSSSSFGTGVATPYAYSGIGSDSSLTGSSFDY